MSKCEESGLPRNWNLRCVFRKKRSSKASLPDDIENSNFRLILVEKDMAEKPNGLF